MDQKGDTTLKQEEDDKQNTDSRDEGKEAKKDEAEEEKVEAKDEVKDAEGFDLGDHFAGLEKPRKEEQKEKDDNQNDDDKSVDDTGTMILKYFIMEDIVDEVQLRTKVNRIYKQSAKLRETLSLENSIRNVVKKENYSSAVEDTITEFVQNMSEFEKNVIKATLGKDIKRRLKEETRNDIAKIEREFRRMKENFSEFRRVCQRLKDEKLAKLSPDKDSVSKAPLDNSNKDVPSQSVDIVDHTEEQKVVETEHQNNHGDAEKPQKEIAVGDKSEEAKDEAGGNLQESSDPNLKKDFIQEEKGEANTIDPQEQQNVGNNANREALLEIERAPQSEKMTEEEQKINIQDPIAEERKEEGVKTDPQEVPNTNENQEEQKREDEPEEEVKESSDSSDDKEAFIYEGYENDFKFLKEDDGDKKSNGEISSRRRSQSDVEDAEGEEHEVVEDQNKENSIEIGALFEDASPTTKRKELSKRNEVSELSKNVVNFFRFDDLTIIRICKVFSVNYDNIKNFLDTVHGFVKDISLNPANELRIFDTILFILFTPELADAEGNSNPISSVLKDLFTSEEDSLLTVYQRFTTNIIAYLLYALDDSSKSYIIFTPVKYMLKFGNKLLDELKAKTNFDKKVDEFFSVVDMIVGLLELKHILEQESQVKDLLSGILSFLKNQKKITLIEGNYDQRTLENYTKSFSHKNIYTLLNILNNPLLNSENLYDKLEELMDYFKALPELFISLTSHLTDYFNALLPHLNNSLEESINLMKSLDPSKVTKNDLETVMSKLSLAQFQTLQTILSSFAGVFYHYLFSSRKKKDVTVVKKIHNLLKDVVGEFFNKPNVSAFMLNIYEAADLIHKTKTPLKLQDSYLDPKLLTIISVCLYHYSIVAMSMTYTPPSEDLDKNKEINSVSDTEVPSLAKLISNDEIEVDNKGVQGLQRTFSHYRRQNNVDFKTVFANFGLKFSKGISQISMQKNSDPECTMSKILSIIVPICPWILDLKTKRRMMT